MRRNWKELPRDKVRPQWAGLYVTLNRKGMIAMNRVAYQKVGSPSGFVVLFDSVNDTIGLRPRPKEFKNAYPALAHGKAGGRRVAAFRLIADCRLKIDDTLEFPDAEIDGDGILVLNLRTAKISNRSLNHWSRRRAKRSA